MAILASRAAHKDQVAAHAKLCLRRRLQRGNSCGGPVVVRTYPLPTEYHLLQPPSQFGVVSIGSDRGCHSIDCTSLVAIRTTKQEDQWPAAHDLVIERELEVSDESVDLLRESFVPTVVGTRKPPSTAVADVVGRCTLQDE